MPKSAFVCVCVRVRAGILPLVLHNQQLLLLTLQQSGISWYPSNTYSNTVAACACLEFPETCHLESSSPHRIKDPDGFVSSHSHSVYMPQSSENKCFSDSGLG